MPVRLSALDRRRQIMRVASGLFARRGYRGTTTREIARRAGVNEALLFRHFPGKEQLYWAIIDEQCGTRGRRHKLDRILEQGGSDLEVFAAIAREFLTRTARDTEVTRLLWFTALENHKLSQRFFRTFVAVYYEALAGYIRRRVREGAFRDVDPLLSARGFFGMVVYHFLVQEIFGGGRYQKFDPEMVADTLAHIWLNGMQKARKPAFSAKYVEERSFDSSSASLGVAQDFACGLAPSQRTLRLTPAKRLNNGHNSNGTNGHHTRARTPRTKIQS